MAGNIYDYEDLKNIFDNLSDFELRWIIALSMAANDLTLLLKLIKQYNDAAESDYFFRLSFSHLREIAKVINSSQKNSEIQCLLKSMDSETQTVYKKISDSLLPFEDGSLTKDILKSTRDECFHYPDILGDREEFKDLPKILKALDQKKVRFDKENNTILGRRYLFADDAVGFSVNKRLSKLIVDQISIVAVSIMQFIDHLLAFLKTK